jgi:hypothetical protein
MRIGMNTTLVLGALAAAYVLEHPASQQRAGGETAGAAGAAGADKGEKRAGGPPKTKRGKQELKATQQALEQELKDAAEAAAHAYAACPNLNVLVEALLEGGIALMQVWGAGLAREADMPCACLPLAAFAHSATGS